MSEPTFQEFIAKERERLEKKRASIQERAAELDEELREVDLETNAIDAYEAARSGKTAPQRAGGTRRTSRRAQILAIIKKHPAGIGRAELLETLGVKGDKSAEQSVSNALANLKKSGTVDNKDGSWTVA